MTTAEIREIAEKNRFPQAAIAHWAMVTTCALSLWLRGLGGLTEGQLDRVETVVTAMLNLTRDTIPPINWSQVRLLEDVMQTYIVDARQALHAG